jgi:hypothetical protein
MNYNLHVADWHTVQARSLFQQYNQQLSAEGLIGMPVLYIIAYRSDKAADLQRQYKAHLEKANSIEGGTK